MNADHHVTETHTEKMTNRDTEAGKDPSEELESLRHLIGNAAHDLKTVLNLPRKFCSNNFLTKILNCSPFPRS